MPRKLDLIVVLLCFCIATQLAGAEVGSVVADVAILNGQVIDGSGGPRYGADLALSGDRISYIGTGRVIEAPVVIDARGLVVAPGFIDGHSHSGEYMVDPANRLNESALAQGITTIAFGADGMFSPDQLATMLAAFQSHGIGTNVAFYVGHNGIREQVMGASQQRAPNGDELAAMAGQVRAGMQMGAVGFSTGLMYEPGMYADTEEVIALTRPVAEFGGIYDSHVRNPSGDLLGSDQEVVTIGAQAEVAAKIGHVKAVCLNNAGASQGIIAMVNTARASGDNVVTDQYPYDGAKTVFLRELFLPEDLPVAELKAGLLDPVRRVEIREASENGIDGGFSWLKATGYPCIRVTHSEDFPQYVGLFLAEIAARQDRNGFDVIADMILTAQHPLRLTLGGIDEADVQAILVQPWNMIVSDGKYINANSSPDQHPRSTGTFPRVLGHYVRELKLLDLEDAVKKMTSQPADFLGLSDRGRLQVGKAADITIFDERTINDVSSWENPLEYATGVSYVLVNGRQAVSEASVVPEPAGIVLLRTRATPARLGDIVSQ